MPSSKDTLLNELVINETTEELLKDQEIQPNQIYVTPDVDVEFVSTSQLENDGEDGSSKFATEDYVNQFGGKIDSISVNGENQTIDENKNVDIKMPTKLSELEGYSDLATNDNLSALEEKVNQNIEDIKTKANTTDLDNYLPLTGGTINGNLTVTNQASLKDTIIDGDATVSGKLYANGGVYTTLAEELKIEDNYIILRNGSEVPLAESEYSGLEFHHYNSNGDDLRLVVGNDGVARIGDKEGILQALATREDKPNDGSLTYWDEASNSLKTDSTITKDTIAKNEDVKNLDSKLQKVVNNETIISNLSGGFAAGNGAVASANNIQLGEGTNLEDKTLQVFEYQLLNAEGKIPDDRLPDALKSSAVLYTEQTLTEDQQAQARTNIGAGTSNFDGAYTSLTGVPTLGTLASKNSITSAEITDGTIIKTDLATAVQTSLGKADTAVQPADLTPINTKNSEQDTAITKAQTTADNAMPKSGGQFTGQVSWNATSLPPQNGAPYFVTIEPFADGGKTYYTTQANVKSALGINTIETTLASKANSSDLSKYLPLTGGTLSGNLTVNGTTTTLKETIINGGLTVKGNITNNGTNYETHAEKVYTKNDYIILREGATGALTDYAGLEFYKYDGTNSGRLVVDNTGTARVGDVGDERPLTTRDEASSLTNQGLMFWDSSSNSIKTDSTITKSTVVLNSGLSNTLKDYVTSTSLSTTLGSYVTTSNLNTTLSSYSKTGHKHTTSDITNFGTYVNQTTGTSAVKGKWAYDSATDTWTI